MLLLGLYVLLFNVLPRVILNKHFNGSKSSCFTLIEVEGRKKSHGIARETVITFKECRVSL